MKKKKAVAKATAKVKAKKKVIKKALKKVKTKSKTKTSTTKKAKRGRPLGSKNKKKEMPNGLTRGEVLLTLTSDILSKGLTKNLLTKSQKLGKVQ